MKTKLLTLLFVIVANRGMMLASIIEGVQIDALIYNLDNVNQTAEVTSNPDSYIGDIIIPSSVEYNEVTYSVTSIGRIAFYGCSSLTSITIPNSIISIGNQAFEDCQSLTSLFIPSSVASIGENVFPWGIRRNEMSVDINNPYYDSRDNCNAIIETATNKLIAGCNSTIIPSSVTIIASGAFDGCYELASVTIPAGVTQIDGRGFAYCTSLKSINIPASVVSIGYFAFDGCSGLTSITVDENNPNYDSRDNCNALIETASNTLIAGCKNTIIPNGISKIEIAAFEECYGLKSIDIPNSVTYIGNSAFQECRSLTSITIPNSVMDMGPYTFCECYALEEIVLSNNITKIESGLFYSCQNLSSIVIPSNVTIIDDKAFYFCKKLTQIVCENVSPPEIAGENVFYEVNKSIPLYVPAQSVEAYRAADGWKEFANIRPIGSSLMVKFVDWNGQTLSFSYVESGEDAVAPADPTREGYTFIGWDKDFTNVTEDLVVTALYEEIVVPTYTIKYKDKEDALLDSEDIELHLPTAPVIEGFTFLKWEVVHGDLADGINIQAVYTANTPTDVPAVYTNPANPAQKLIRQGNVYILTGDKTYTITGQAVK